jgi:hypothetical protein
MKNKDNPAPVAGTTQDEEELSERASAPTLRDLRAWAKDLLKTLEKEADLTPPDDGPSQQEDH